MYHVEDESRMDPISESASIALEIKEILGKNSNELCEGILQEINTRYDLVSDYFTQMTAPVKAAFALRYLNDLITSEPSKVANVAKSLELNREPVWDLMSHYAGRYIPGPTIDLVAFRRVIRGTSKRYLHYSYPS